jgi:hypothetical protein
MDIGHRKRIFQYTGQGCHVRELLDSTRFERLA